MSSADLTAGKWLAPALVGQLVGWLVVNQLLWLVGRQPQINRLTKPFGWLVGPAGRSVGRSVGGQSVGLVGWQPQTDRLTDRQLQPQITRPTNPGDPKTAV